MKSKKELIEKYKAKMQECAEDGNFGNAHLEADMILTDLLEEIGFGEVVEIYDKVGKWYD